MFQSLCCHNSWQRKHLHRFQREAMCPSTWKVMSHSIWDQAKVAPMARLQALKCGRKQSVTVKLQVRVEVTALLTCKKKGKTSADSGLQCHGDQMRTADRPENPDEHLVPPGPRKELMKRCSVEKLLTFGNLGPFHRRRSPGMMHRQNWIADSEFMEQPQMVFLLLYWIPSRVRPLHPYQQFGSDIGHRSIKGSCQGCRVRK